MSRLNSLVYPQSLSLHAQARLLLVLALGVLLMSCTRTATPSLPVVSVAAAQETIVQFNHSGIRSSSQEVAIIPPEFWTAEIKRLEPVQVLWHNNNLVAVFAQTSAPVDGVYVQIPISSYFAGKNGDRFTLTDGGGATYTLVIQSN